MSFGELDGLFVGVSSPVLINNDGASCRRGIETVVGDNAVDEEELTLMKSQVITKQAAHEEVITTERTVPLSFAALSKTTFDLMAGSIESSLGFFGAR